MTTAKKPAAAKPAAKAKPEPKPVEEVVEPEVEAGPVVVTEFTFDGVRAVDTITTEDGSVSTVAREATFEEQIGVLAPQILEQAVGIVHLAGSGFVECEGNVVTITLVSR